MHNESAILKMEYRVYHVTSKHQDAAVEKSAWYET